MRPIRGSEIKPGMFVSLTPHDPAREVVRVEPSRVDGGGFVYVFFKGEPPDIAFLDNHWYALREDS